MELNIEIIKKIVGFVEKGILQDEACMKAGIDQQTFDGWKDMGKTDRKVMYLLCWKLNFALERAEAAFRLRLIEIIRSHATEFKDGNAALWMLVHKVLDEYGVRTPQEEEMVDELNSSSTFDGKPYNQLLDDSNKDWRAAAYILVDRFPEEYGRKPRIKKSKEKLNL